MNIKYVHHRSIDLAQWDEVVSEGVLNVPYAYSWYLDIVTRKRWDALIADDYRFIFPLPYTRKYKVLGSKKYVHPLFNQQLGVFSKEPFGMEELQAFLQSIPAEFKLMLNNGKNLKWYNEGADFTFRERSNFTLDLSSSYEELRSNYSKSLKKRLRKAKDSHSLKLDDLSPKALVDTYRKVLNTKVQLKPRHYQLILRLIQEAIQRNKGQIWTSRLQSGEIGAAGFFFMDNGRIINLFGTSTPIGYSSYSMHYLLDALIQEYAGQKGWLFDFEGSSIPSIAQFFASFGSSDVPYWEVSRYEKPI